MTGNWKKKIFKGARQTQHRRASLLSSPSYQWEQLFGVAPLVQETGYAVIAVFGRLLYWSCSDITERRPYISSRTSPRLDGQQTFCSAFCGFQNFYYPGSTFLDHSWPSGKLEEGPGSHWRTAGQKFSSSPLYCNIVSVIKLTAELGFHCASGVSILRY